MATQPKLRYTSEEYLTLERAAAYKSEYLNGEIFAMSGGSIPHTFITANIVRFLGNRFEGRDCWAVSSDLRVQVAPTGLYTYPDVVAGCGPLEVADGHNDTILNPLVIFEVLSPSTEAYDRGEKFVHYRRLESLTDYVLVAQDRVRVEHYVRQGHQWVLTEISDPEDTIRLESIGCDLALAEVYSKVVFPEQAAEVGS